MTSARTTSPSRRVCLPPCTPSPRTGPWTPPCVWQPYALCWSSCRCALCVISKASHQCRVQDSCTSPPTHPVHYCSAQLMGAQRSWCTDRHVPCSCAPNTACPAPCLSCACVCSSFASWSTLASPGFCNVTYGELRTVSLVLQAGRMQVLPQTCAGRWGGGPVHRWHTCSTSCHGNFFPRCACMLCWLLQGLQGNRVDTDQALGERAWL
jgi:hypothetical protein